MLERMKNLSFKNLKYLEIFFVQISSIFSIDLTLDPDSDPSLIDVDETGRKTFHENSLSTTRKFD